MDRSRRSSLMAYMLFENKQETKERLYFDFLTKQYELSFIVFSWTKVPHLQRNYGGFIPHFKAWISESLCKVAFT